MSAERGATSKTNVRTFQNLPKPHHQRDPRILISLRPRRKKIMTKLALRCSDCFKFVAKPVLNAKLIKFDKRSAARDIIPRCYLSEFEPFQRGVAKRIILYLANPLQSPIEFRIRKVSKSNTQVEPEYIVGTSAPIQDDSFDLSGPVHVDFSEDPITIDPFDPTVQQDDPETDPSRSPSDELAVIAKRDRNVVGVFLTVNPGETCGRINFSIEIRLKYEQEIMPVPEVNILLDLDLGSTE
eukprot:277349_1